METIRMQYLTESSPPAYRANFKVICPRGRKAMAINTSRRSVPAYLADRSAPSNHDDAKTGEGRSGLDHSPKGPT
jgi:hypothetical protein